MTKQLHSAKWIWA